MKTFLSKSPRETLDLGRAFAADLKPGDVVAIFGNLGSGKTQFVAGACSGLGVRAHVTSPSFTIINEYDAPPAPVAHIDLYRIDSEREIAELGLEEYFAGRHICFIEWPDPVVRALPRRHYEIKIGYGPSRDEREIRVELFSNGIAA